MRSTCKASQMMKAVSYEYAFVGRSHVQSTYCMCILDDFLSVNIDRPYSNSVQLRTSKAPCSHAKVCLQKLSFGGGGGELASYVKLATSDTQCIGALARDKRTRFGGTATYLQASKQKQASILRNCIAYTKPGKRLSPTKKKSLCHAARYPGSGCPGRCMCM